MLLCLHRIFPYGFVASAALVLSNGQAGPFVTAAQGECNDSIKPQSVVVAASGWCIDRAPVRRRRARGRGGEQGVQMWSNGGTCTHMHAKTRPGTISSLIYSRSALMSSWPRPQLPSTDDLAPVLMKEQGNSTEVKEKIHTHTDTNKQAHIHARRHTTNTGEKAYEAQIALAWPANVARKLLIKATII